MRWGVWAEECGASACAGRGVEPKKLEFDERTERVSLIPPLSRGFPEHAKLLYSRLPPALHSSPSPSVIPMKLFALEKNSKFAALSSAGAGTISKCTRAMKANQR